jgi:Diacylglycerol kinase
MFSPTVRSTVKKQMKSLLNPEDGAPLSEEISQRSTHQAHRAAQRGAWRIAGDLPASFRYATQGLVYGFVSQRNFRIHVCIGSVVFGLGVWLQLPPIQLAVLVLTVAAVLVLELLNTAIESVVDLAIGRRFHPLARIAKDCAAAAVLVAAISSLLIALLLLLPPLTLRLSL